MSKKRGLSLEEKRKVVLDIFHETREPYTFKDIEKVATKRGVVSQTVKEVVQSLADDDLINVDKIGSSTYYWSFPSETHVKLTTQLHKAERDAEEAQGTLELLNCQLAESRQGKEDSPPALQALAQADRSAKLDEIATLQARSEQQARDLAQQSSSDPERFQQIRDATLIARAAADRWLDNVEVLRSWLKRRFEGQDEQVAALFKEVGYKEDMEYLQV